MGPFLIEFEWQRDTKKYEFRPGPSPKHLRKTFLTADEPDRIAGRGGALETYQPLKFPGLYKIFAALDGTTESFVGFADKYGPLSKKWDDLVLWKDAHERMKWAVEVSAVSPFEMPVLAAKEGQEEELTNLSLILRASLPGARPTLILKPRSLLSTMYLQLAQDLISGVSVRACENCGSWFQTGGSTRKRSDARFCSDTCRATFHYREKRHAEKKKLRRRPKQRRGKRKGGKP